MAPAKDKWIRRFIITETRRHKKGFTIYKVISIIFLKSSHEEVSKVSVWKRYSDFKKLHSELSNLHKHLGMKESFPTFPKSKYFGRFEAEIIEERKKYALKFLEFVGRYSYLYSSDIFITFFETSYTNNYTNDYTNSLSSDTSEDDCIVTLSDSVPVNDTVHNTSKVSCLSKTPGIILTNSRSTLSNVICANENEFAIYQRKNESHGSINLQNANVNREEQSCKTAKFHVPDTITKNCDAYIENKSFDKNNITTLSNVSRFDSLNNNISKNLSNYDICSTYSIILHEEVNLSQAQPDSTQYLLIAAAHISAAYKHESIAEYKEAFTQYKLGISCLINGVQFDPDSTRVPNIKDKISKYLACAEQLYNRHLNCNISIVKKPISELQYYKVLKIMKSVMLVMDIRTNCNRVIKTVEKSYTHEDRSNFVLHKQVPYMIHLYACVETETTIFLILQYASSGKLWDFIRLHYKVSDSLCNIISYQACINSDINEEANSNGNIRGPDKIDKITENNQVQRDHQYMTDVQSEIYMEMPTIKLLEKSQELLESVNATLRKSNSIAKRLNEHKELRHSGSIPSLNAKTVRRVSQGSDLTLSNIYRNTSSKDMIDDIIVVDDPTIKSFVENKDLKGNNSLTNNNKNSNVSENICASILSGSCTTRESLENNKMSNLLYNNSTLRTISTQNISANNVVHICKNNDTEGMSNQTNLSNVNCSINETQYPHSCKENNADEEQELWQVSETVIRSWAAEILSALEVLHQQNVLILDFKPDNILLDDAGHIQLTYIIPQRNIELSKLTYPYSSPEAVKFSPTTLVTSATDVWSFGVMLYELFTGITFVRKHPGSFHSHSTINIPSRLSESARSLLYGMLKYHPEERLTIDEIKRHPFFAGIDWLNMINSRT